MIAQFHTVTLPVIARVVFMASAFLMLLVFAAPSVHAESWSVWEFRDEMDEAISKGAASAWTTPTRALSFPHHDLRGMAGFGCENGIPSFYFGFTETPNLSGNETLASLLDGSEVLRTRIKFDHDDPKDIALWRNWGRDTLLAVSYEPGGDNNSFLGWHNSGGDLNAPDLEWFERVISGSTMLLELSWYSLGSVFFRFDLRGSAKALREAGCFVE